ncbi:MAG TPA: carboxypeptidase-like regulatory domain-containing protein, partial [Candidatus Acidoferrum sp.]|nr:carboxypeptidase-like regulatory domain-containing protein [Candidatus Acidoferrum sp.]
MSLLSKMPLRLHLLVGLLVIGGFQMAWVAPAKAQVAGATLSGLVTDDQGGPVANATVSVKNAGTGVAREVSSNSDGIYSAPNLLPGEYEVTVTATGFQTLTEKGITLTV